MSLPSEEQWRPIPGYGGRYEISDQGRVRSFAKPALPGVILRTYPTHKGYLRVRLHHDAESRRHTVHSLVAAAFIGPRPEGFVVRHIDGNQLNNASGNLAYGTQSENEQDKLRHGNHRNANKVRCVRGHSLTDPENVRVRRGRGGRECLACAFERRQEAQWERDRDPEKAAAYRAKHAAGERERQARLRAARQVAV